MNAIHVTAICEIWTTEGPTGDFAEVLEGEVRDAGGNVLFSGAAVECVKEAAKYRIQVKCWPIKVSANLPEGSSGEHCFGLFIRADERTAV